MGLEIGTAGITIDETGERLLAAFGDELGDLRVQEPDTLVCRVARERLHDVARRLKDLPGIGYPTCNWVAGVDYVTHFESVYHLYSWGTNSSLEIHVEIPRDDAVCDSVCDIFPAADWHERESWDMLGIRYEGHPDLRRILLRDDFVGHPLRKDYVDLIENHPNA
ncbi:MAG TPA: NADH-quinone oxidoreductase subunit C [Thermoleophilia bacterium]|nr:NADH-quinone oxidoreductase subunit C [Thermoleophilia bacterium]